MARREATTRVQTARMPPWVPRAVVLFFATGAAAILLWRFLGLVDDIIMLVVVSLFASFAIEPAVNWLAARGWRRGVATALILFGVFLLGALMIGAMIPVVVRQLQGLIQNLPEYVDRIGEYTQRWFGVELSSERIVQDVQQFREGLQNVAADVAGNLLGIAQRLIGALFQLLTVALFTFYFVAEGPRMRRGLCSLLPRDHQREVLRVLEIAVDKTGGYLYSRLLLAGISGLATFVILLALGVPFAAPLAIWQGLLSQFIPVVGTYIAAALPLLISLIAGSGTDALVLLVFFLVYQQVENYLLSPKITARTMQLHPVTTIIAAVVGARLGGAIGAFLALPAAAILQASLGTYVTRYEVVDDELTREQEERGRLDAERERVPWLRRVRRWITRG